MDLLGYFRDAGAELDKKSLAIRRDFATHRGAGGSNRENLLAEMLRAYLPREFGIDTGLLTSHDGQFSNQADLFVTDHSWNAPFYPSGPNRIWLVEAVYALIEVKTNLTLPELKDSVSKCQRFKRLPRHFSEAPTLPRLTESLFVIWAFESPSPETLKENLVTVLREVPPAEQPDFVVVPSSLVATSGHYREISVLGQTGSLHRQGLERLHGPSLATFHYDPIQVAVLGQDALITWLLWFLSWLKRAGSRNSELLRYIPYDQILARHI